MTPVRRCRTCLSDQNLHPLFLLPEYSEQYSSAVFLVTGVKINTNDSLPKEICSTCISFINKSLKFRKKCKESQQMLLDNCELNGVHVKKLDFKGTKTASIDISYSLDDIQCNDLELNVYVNVKSEVLEPNEHAVVKMERQSDDECDNSVMNIKVEVPLEYDYTQNDGSVEESGLGEDKTEMVEIQVEPMDILPNMQDSFIHVIKKDSTYKELLEEIKKAGLSRGRTHRCLYCQYSTTSREALNIHIRHHTGEKPYECDHCGASFHGRNNLIQHIAIHLPEKKFKCDLCPKFFKSRKFVLVHKHNVHTGKRYRYVCSVCKHTYEKPNKVRLHAKRVHKLTAEQLGPIIRVEVRSVAHKDGSSTSAQSYTDQTGTITNL